MTTGIDARSVAQLLRSTRYNIAQIDADLAAMAAKWPTLRGEGAEGTYHQGYQNGRKAELETLATLLELALAVDDQAVGPAHQAAQERARAEHRTHAYPSRDRRGYWQAVCAKCGPVGVDQPHEYDADAIAARHQKIGGFEHTAPADVDDQADVDDRIARHEEFLGSEGADHLYPHGAG